MNPTKTLSLLKRSGLSPPETLTLAVTSSCNLSCAHCWVGAGSSASAAPVPTETLRGIIRDFSQLGGSGLRLTGGEPLLHPDWLELLRYAAGFGLVRLILQTNGMLFRSTELTALQGLDLKGLQIQISLDGATAAAHDLIRGEGAYAQALQGIELLSRFGFAQNIALFFTEMRHNLHELPELFLLAEHLGVGSVSSGSLVQCGRARADQVISPPQPEQYPLLLERFAADSRFQQLYSRLGQVAALEWSSCEFTQQGCSFIKNPYLSAQGVLYPCLMCHADDYSVVEVLEKGLCAALEEGAPRWFLLQRLSRERATVIPDCQTCDLLQSCAGGCMGRAWGSFGAFLVAEDRCQQRQEVVSWKEKN